MGKKFGSGEYDQKDIFRLHIIQLTGYIDGLMLLPERMIEVVDGEHTHLR